MCVTCLDAAVCCLTGYQREKQQFFLVSSCVWLVLIHTLVSDWQKHTLILWLPSHFFSTILQLILLLALLLLSCPLLGLCGSHLIVPLLIISLTVVLHQILCQLRLTTSISISISNLCDQVLQQKGKKFTLLVCNRQTHITQCDLRDTLTYKCAPSDDCPLIDVQHDLVCCVLQAFAEIPSHIHIYTLSWLGISVRDTSFSVSFRFSHRFLPNMQKHH